jgi:hypothetical protein
MKLSPVLCHFQAQGLVPLRPPLLLRKQELARKYNQYRIQTMQIRQKVSINTDTTEGGNLVNYQPKRRQNQTGTSVENFLVAPPTS